MYYAQSRSTYRTCLRESAISWAIRTSKQPIWAEKEGLMALNANGSNPVGLTPLRGVCPPRPKVISRTVTTTIREIRIIPSLFEKVGGEIDEL